MQITNNDSKSMKCTKSRTLEKLYSERRTQSLEEVSCVNAVENSLDKAAKILQVLKL